MNLSDTQFEAVCDIDGERYTARGPNATGAVLNLRAAICEATYTEPRDLYPHEATVYHRGELCEPVMLRFFLPFRGR